MAEIKSFPNNQDVYVGAEWVMKWLHGRTSGVFGAESNLATSVVADSMSVEVSDGVGWLSNNNGDGIVFWNDNEQTTGNKLKLTHDVADGTLGRIDRIVVTWETTNYVALPTISVLKGKPSSSPVAPTLTNNTTQRQISLAKVSIPAGTVSLSASMITDERLNESVCGIVTERVSVDTSMVHSQIADLIEKIEKELENAKSGTPHVLKTGDTITGPINMSNNRIVRVGQPVEDSDATPKSYVDDKIVDLYPVGSIYMSLNETSPSNYFGGTWVRLKDRFLLGAGDIYEGGETGGSQTVKLSVSNLPAHTHKVRVSSGYNTGGVSTSQLQSGKGIGSNSSGNEKVYVNDNSVTATGEGAAHNNMPPYLVVYMWARTA